MTHSSKRGKLKVSHGIALLGSVLALALTPALTAQIVPSNNPARYGPYSGDFLTGGMGMRKPLANSADTVLLPASPWTLSCWFRSAAPVSGRELLAGLGDVSGEYPRFLALEDGKAELYLGENNLLVAPAAYKPGEWHLLSASFDGNQAELFFDGKLLDRQTLSWGTPTPVLQMAPSLQLTGQSHFGGQIGEFTLDRHAFSTAEHKSAFAMRPNFPALPYEEGSKSWQVQSRAWTGYRGPQDPQTMPTSRARFPKAIVVKRPDGPSLTPTEGQGWAFTGGWTLRQGASQPAHTPAPPETSAASTKGPLADAEWMRATVPGTVLTTLVDDGVYPDPDFGLNNMAIPESLNKQPYWYRNSFALPANLRTQLAQPNARVELTFAGINYQAEIWLNGILLGEMKGAFNRGTYDVTRALRPAGQNMLAVRISPPPHPGIPNEQSILGGAGENGGSMELDGPTFLATEGWDWIPAIRDRNTGIWQPVTLLVTHGLQLGDTQVTTTFQKHDTSRAFVAFSVAVDNPSLRPAEALLNLSFDDIAVQKRIMLQPGANTVALTPAEFPQLAIARPALWWPNGYGQPTLHTATLTARLGTNPSGSLASTATIRFGMREISYELSLLDHAGHLRRVEFTPASALGANAPIVDVSHEGMRQIPGIDAVALDIPEARREEYQFQTAVSSLPQSAENSPAIETLVASPAAPYLVIKVNGVRIAARGGNWGMDDSRKRVTRAHLEPFFRLHRDANLNLIRNWVGQNTEEVFYDLADEYGLLIWNDFWESTQNYNIEAEDPDLFLANAADTIRHFRNHPSIALWCGRNEGVPQPILNAGLEQMVRTLDGTRFYSPSSNQVNLQLSGPYSYQDPTAYYTTLNRGFSVETGTPSMSTLESFESTNPREDWWPIDDVWAYHDWHSGGNGTTAPFMAEIEREFGAPISLPDFERKAQMLNYVNHRAIFEGMNANLWTPNSGRLLWMTQPSWPSTMWQILSADYDTQASFYGTKKACEPLHVQLNLADYQVDAVNTTPNPHPGLTVVAQVYSLTGALLSEKKAPLELAADQRTPAFRLDLAAQLAHGMVLVRLELLEGSGTVLSRNFYWLGGKPADARALTRLDPMPVQIKTTRTGERSLTVTVTNPGAQPSFENKLTLTDQDGRRILPVYYTDNYISLLPGESQTIQIEIPQQSQNTKLKLALRGWNTIPQVALVP